MNKIWGRLQYKHVNSTKSYLIQTGVVYVELYE